MLCRLYVDEVGNNDLRNATHNDNVRFLSLTGFLTFRDCHDREIQPAVDTLKLRFFGNEQVAPVILHRRDIVNRQGPFSVLNDPKTRHEFDEAILGLMGSLPYLVNTVTIDKREHFERYAAWHFDPYHYCMRCLIERYVLWLRRNGWQGDVVAEARFKKADKKLKASFRNTWENGTENIPPEIVQERLTSRELKFFGKAENCAGLQLCDLIAHPAFRGMKLLRDGQPTPTDFGGSVQQILERAKWARNPKNGLIDGWGRKWLP